MEYLFWGYNSFTDFLGHPSGIFTYIWLTFMVNVAKYTIPIDPMGY